MGNKNRFLVTAIGSLLLLVGCASVPERELSSAPIPYAFLPNGRDPLHPDRFGAATHLKADASGEISVREGAITFFERERGHALNILELSGGGQNGAFGAGFLKGWRESGHRPKFDVVTGVSTGALLSTHAFLGTPADDAVLEALFTRIDKDDIYHKRNLLGAFLHSNALLDTAPLKRKIEEVITEEVLERVAAEYDEGRRLVVGTTNLDYDQTWIWNLSLIAKTGGPEALELYRKVLRASASPPVAFPPVQIEGYLFADGATRSNLLVMGIMGEERPPPPLYGPGNIFVIHNGKEQSPPKAVRERLIPIVGTATEAMMSSSMASVLMRAYFAAQIHGYNFNLVHIPDDAAIGRNALAFDPAEMRAAFDAGYELGQQHDPWAKVPPTLGQMPEWALEIMSVPR